MRYIILISFIALMVAACAPEQEITTYEQCIAAGNPMMKSNPPQCAADGQVFVQQMPKLTIHNFDECVKAGNPVMESYPRQCNADGQNFVEEIPAEPSAGKHVCTAGEKAAIECTLEYAPVCGDNDKTYGNGCGACASKEIDSYVPGECAAEKPIGGDSDEHGCKASAGYAWDAEIGACARGFELDETERYAAISAVAPLSFPVTVVSVEAGDSTGSYIVTLQRHDTGEQFEVSIVD